MTWNYRVVRRRVREGEYEYSIHECYYDQPRDAIPRGWTASPISATSSSRDDLLWSLTMMVDATRRPVLEETEGEKLIEVEPAVEDDMSEDKKTTG